MCTIFRFRFFASKTFDYLVDCPRFSLELCLIENLNLNNFKFQKTSRTFSNNLKKTHFKSACWWNLSTWHDLLFFNSFLKKDRKFSNCRIDFDHFWKLNWVRTLHIICSIKCFGKSRTTNTSRARIRGWVLEEKVYYIHIKCSASTLLGHRARAPRPSW